MYDPRPSQLVAAKLARPVQLESETIGGHDVTPLIDGTSIFASLYRDMQRARRNIYIAQWHIAKDFLLDLAENLTLDGFIKRALIENPELEVYFLLSGNRLARLLLGPGLSKWRPSDFSTPATLNRLHLQYQNHPHWLGTHHQKFILSDLSSPEDTGHASATDDASLHLLGLNFENLYWDLPTHPCRPPMGSSVHDTGIRVRGPIVRDFEMEFRRRWFEATGNQLPYPRFCATPRGTVRVVPLIKPEQMQPNSIENWYREKIAGAQNYIYIENQYFENQTLADLLISQFLERERAGRALQVAIMLPDLGRRPGYLQLFFVDIRRAVRRIQVSTIVKWQNTDGETIRRPVGGWHSIRIPRLFGQGTPIVARAWPIVSDGKTSYESNPNRMTNIE